MTIPPEHRQGRAGTSRDPAAYGESQEEKVRRAKPLVSPDDLEVELADKLRLLLLGKNRDSNTVKWLAMKATTYAQAYDLAGSAIGAAELHKVVARAVAVALPPDAVDEELGFVGSDRATTVQVGNPSFLSRVFGRSRPLVGSRAMARLQLLAAGCGLVVGGYGAWRLLTSEVATTFAGALWRGLPALPSTEVENFALRSGFGCEAVDAITTSPDDFAAAPMVVLALPSGEVRELAAVSLLREGTAVVAPVIAVAAWMGSAAVACVVNQVQTQVVSDFLRFLWKAARRRIVPSLGMLAFTSSLMM